MSAHTIVVVSAGLSQPSSTRLLADRLAAATARGLTEEGETPPQIVSVELRDHAQELVNNLLTGFPSGRLREAIDGVMAADALIAVSPIFNASFSGLFKMFFDVLELDSLSGKPVLIAATGGTARHSLALEHALRPLFAYLGAAVVPTAVFAATEDWGTGGTGVDRGLVDRIDRAGRELSRSIILRERRPAVDPFAEPTPFEELLRANRGHEILD